MLKALTIKELRESAAIVAIAVVVAGWLLGNLTGSQVTPFRMIRDVERSVPFVNNEYSMGLVLLGGGLAVALGIKQTAWENSGNKYYFLLHRPITRNVVFLVKILFGLTCLLVLTVGSLLLYANWAATPGNHASPFFWGMTSMAWLTCLALPSIYFGAMLSGLRPANWFGTRLLPLVGTGILTILSIVCWAWLHWTLGLACLIALDVVLLRLILATAERRDY